MKIITFYTSSHRPLFDRFLSTLRLTNPQLEVAATEMPQRSRTGVFGTVGFNESMQDKIDVILSHWSQIRNGEHFLFSDCDVQFLKEFVTDIQSYDQSKDILFQDNVDCFCAGFMYCKKTALLKDFLLMVKKLTPQHQMDDQGAINYLLDRGEHGLSVGLLPRTKYFTVAAATGERVWRGEKFQVPPEVLVHHANWTVGIRRKIRLMDVVSSSVGSVRL